jgi:hypothetical protein
LIPVGPAGDATVFALLSPVGCRYITTTSLALVSGSTIEAHSASSIERMHN